MAYFDELLQRAITVRNNVAPSSNTALLVGGVLVSIVNALQMLLDDKQEALTFDTTPTDGSLNPVTSEGIFEALQAIDLSACEKIINKVTSISAQSTDVQYPSAKLLYDQLQALAQIYAPLQHTHGWLEVLTPSVAATVNAQGYNVTTTAYSHILTITADATLHLPAMTAGQARMLRLCIIQDGTGGRSVTFDGGDKSVYNPQQVDLSQGAAGQRCWVTLLFDGAQWAYWATPYILRPEGSFDFYLYGTSTGSTVSVTINGTPMSIPVNAGAWEYGYTAANAITSIAFTGDTNVTTIDFSSTDGLAGVTSLDNAFKGCTALASVDFTNCDLSAIVSATDCFDGCTALAALTIPSGEWLPDLDLSATAIGYSAMADVIIGLHTYASGTHTVTFNSTIWDALTQAQQQTISDAAGAKGWTTNAPMVVYVIRGTSSNVGGTETFTLQFIDDNTQAITTETITCAVDGTGNWEYQYYGKKIYSTDSTFENNTTITSIEFTEELNECVSMEECFYGATALISANFPNAEFKKCLRTTRALRGCTSLTTVSFPNATFDILDNMSEMFYYDAALTSIAFPKANFDNLTALYFTFANCTNLLTITFKNGITMPNLTSIASMCSSCTNLTSINMQNVTFANCGTVTNTFANCKHLEELDLSAATFAEATTIHSIFAYNNILKKVILTNATFAKVTIGIRMFRDCPQLAEIQMPSATFPLITSNGEQFYNNNALTTITLPQSATYPITLTFRYSPLNYTSMLAVANWLKDLSGGTAQTITYKASAWNALSTAEQTNIDTILSGKNWTRAIA